MIARDLLADIADQARAWAAASTEQRIIARQRFRSEGWTICPHPTCPPWDCQETNGR